MNKKDTAVVSQLMELFKANDQNKILRESVRKIADFLGRSGIKRLNGEAITQNVNDAHISPQLQIIREQLNPIEHFSDEIILSGALKYYYQCVERSL